MLPPILLGLGVSALAVPEARDEPDLALSADRLRIEGRANRLRADGNVILNAGTATLTASSVAADLDARTATASGAVRIAAPPVLARCELAALREGRFVAERVMVYPCACGGAPGALRVDARRATIDPDRGVLLESPTLRIGEVPVLWLPILYAPVGERRSGLLPPVVGTSPGLGLFAKEPVYLAPDPSWDLTLSPGFALRRGPLLGIEGRWALAEAALSPWRLARGGAARLDGLLDLARTPEGGSLDGRPLPRAQLRALHADGLGGGPIIAEIDLVGDADYRLRFGATYLERQAEWTRSSVTWVRPEGPYWLIAALTFWQDLRPETVTRLGPGVSPRAASAFSSRGPSAVRQRLLELELAEPARPMFSRSDDALGSGRARVSLHGGLEDTPSFVRADLRRALHVRLASSADLGAFLETEIAGRLTGWGASQAAARGAVLFTTRLGAERVVSLAGSDLVLGGRLEHLLLPATWVLGAPDRFFTGDEVDLLGPAHQVLGSLMAEVYDESVEPRAVFEARLGTDLDIPAGRRGEGLSELDLELSLLLAERGDAAARGVGSLLLDLSTRALTRLSLGARVRAGWLWAEAGYIRWGSQPPRFPFVAPEELVPSPNMPRVRRLPPPAMAALSLEEQALERPWSPLDGVDLGVGARLGASVELGLTVGLAFDPAPSWAAGAGPYGELRAPHPLRDLLGQLRVAPPCGCFRAELFAGVGRDLAGVTVGTRLELTP